MYALLALLLMIHCAMPADGASRVIEVGPRGEWVFVSHDAPVRWVRESRACVSRGRRPIGCGRIVELFPNYAKLEIEEPRLEPGSPAVTKGDAGTFVDLRFVRRLPRPGDLVEAKLPVVREPAAAPIERIEGGPEDLNHFELLKDHIYPMNAATIGLYFVIPTFHFQHAVTRHFAVGLGALHMTYPRPNGQLQGPGGMLSLNWYFNAPFTGWFLELALGAYDLEAQQSGVNESIVGLTGILNVGWKWRWSWGLNFGAGLGVQSLVATRQRTATVDVPLFIPSLALDIGFAF